MLCFTLRKMVLILPVVAALAAPAFAANDNNYTYLALGDSIPFGLNPLILPPYTSPTQLPTPSQFVGYPEVVAAVEHVAEVNASCPGETSGSFLNTASPDNGCNSSHFLPPPAAPIPPFKTAIGLHTNYTGDQMKFAEGQLKNNKRINLVTLSIGANDVLLILPQLTQCGADQACANGVLKPVLDAYGNNLAMILSRIRAQYSGMLIMTKYYSPSPALDSLTVAVNSVMTQVVADLSKQRNFAPIQFADGFTAFQLVSALHNHDACQAGLLVRLPDPPPAPPCDIHPSRLGQELLAATVELAKVLAQH
jgi:lysophospholipase L1-like esterase